MNRLFQGFFATTLLCTASFAQLQAQGTSVPVANIVDPEPMLSASQLVEDPSGGVATSPGAVVFDNSGALAGAFRLRRASGSYLFSDEAVLAGTARELRRYTYSVCGNGPAWNATSELWTDDPVNLWALAPILGTNATLPGATNGDLGASGFVLCGDNEVKVAPGIILPGTVWLVLTSDFVFCESPNVCVPAGTYGSYFATRGPEEVGTSDDNGRRSPAGGAAPPPWAAPVGLGGTTGFTIYASGDAETCDTCNFINEGVFSGSIVGSATPELPRDLTSACGSEARDADWYCYTATCDGQATVNTCSGPDDDTTVGIFADCDTGDLSIACGDDGCGASGYLTASFGWSVSAGTTYRIRVAGWGSTIGVPAYTMEVTCTPAVCGNGVLEPGEECDDGNDTNPLDGCHGCEIQVEPNELCQGAINIPITINGLGIGTGQALPDLTLIDNVGDPLGSCWTGGGVGALWYSFVASHTSARVHTCDSPIGDDSEIAVFDSCATPVELGCSDDVCGASGYNSDVCVQGLTPGNTYYILIAAWQPISQLPYQLDIEAPCPEFQIGACCDISLGCTDNVDATTCAATGVFAGIGSVCGATQSCCFAGTCFEVPEACCAASGGTSAPGACLGDPDGDGLDTTCGDNCPNASNPLQQDGDGDGFGNACDNCPAISNPGQENADGDSCGDVCDGCPANAALCAPGICGCDTTDTDGDGTLDCVDGCPADPNKTAPGQCGCGVADTDSDGDGTANCNDGCPNDPNKIAPGTCGCGVADTDSDGDGTPNCNDQCPNDPLKIAPGVCGCGQSDVDSDLDGVPNCNDGCPNDPNKTAPGACGCGSPDTDTDNDGVLDCDDICPGADDTVDNNGNGVPDCTGEPIPTVSEWGLVIMTLLLLTAGKVYFGNRRFSVVR